MGLMEGKRGIILGVANEMSIAWGIAQQLRAAGAELAFTYLNESLEKRVRPLAESLDSKLILPCDVGSDEAIATTFKEVEKVWGKIDFVVHSVAFANRDDLRRPFTETSRDGFAMAMDISAYSLVAVSRYAAPLMTDGGSILSLTYLGSVRAVPNYNVMGVAKAALESCTRYLAAELGEKKIRVNCISAGPIRTLAASGVAGMREKIKYMDVHAPLRRAVDQTDVGKSALYFCSDLSSGVTGEIHYVDGGFSTIVNV